MNCINAKLAIATFSVCLLSSAGAVLGDDSPQSFIAESVVLKAPHIPDDLPATLRTVNEMLSKEVTPSDNAVVILVEIFGTDVFEPSLREASLDMLGIAHVPDRGVRFVYAEPFIQSQQMTTPGGTNLKSGLLEQQMYECSERIWTANEFPVLAAYLAANQKALDSVVLASEKPRYFAPMLSDSEPPRLLSASLVIERRLPYLAHALTARAMLRYADQEFSLALNDLRACHKIALLLATGSPFDVSSAKAHIIDGLANRTAVTMLESGRLTGEQARTYLAEMQKVAPLPPASFASDRGERVILHEEIALLKASDETLEEFFEMPSDKIEPRRGTGLKLSDVRFDLATKVADAVHDNFVRALAIRSHAEQIEEFHKLDRQYDKWLDESEETSRKLLDSSNRDLDIVSRVIGETMAMSLRPWYWQRRTADDRMRTRRDLVKVGMALSAFHDDHNQYPEQLSDLMPIYLPNIPLDSFSDASFAYRRISAHQAQLTSWGANRQDDAGRYFNDDHQINLRRTEGSKSDGDSRSVRCQAETQ